MKWNMEPLIRARQLKRMSRAELAYKIGRCESVISLAERGIRAGEKTVFLMSKCLGVPMEDIIKEKKVKAS